MANLPLLLFFVGFIVCYAGAPYAEVRAALSHPIVAVLMGLVVISGLARPEFFIEIEVVAAGPAA